LEKGGLEIVEIDVPDPGPGEVQVRAAACGICAFDIGVFKRGRQGAGGFWPAGPGHEGVGYIARIGAGVRGLKEGDRVANGGFTGVMNFAASSAYVIPPSDLPDEYWIVEPVSCVVTGLDTSRLRAGDRVAVLGCGFMGLMFVQVLAHTPVDQLIAIDISDERLALAAGFGASRVANANAAGFSDELATLRSLDIDVVIDCTGAKQGLDLAARLVRTGGLISLFGWIRGEAAVQGDAWHLGGFTVVNSSPLARIRDPFPAAIRLIHKGIINLKPLVTDVVPLSGYGALLDEVVKGRRPTYVKGVVKLSGLPEQRASAESRPK
jgi:threonine dehydrogenase-like Zn-dependent dehydrogenase